MRKAIYKIRDAITIVICSAMVACQSSTNSLSTISVDNKSSFENKSTDFKDILKDDDVKCEKEKSFQVKASDVDDLMKKVPKELSSKPIDFRDKPFGYYSDPDFGRKYPYSQVDPIPKDLKTGSISLIFKDEYKIRLKNYLENFSKYQKKSAEIKIDDIKKLRDQEPLLDEFSSLNKDVLESKGKELNKLNEILRSYNVSNVSLSIGIADGEENEKTNEDNNQKIYDNHGYDINNTYSSYKIEFKDINVSNLVNELRELEVVRQCNYNPIPVSDYNESNENIFNNNNTLPVTTSLDGINYINKKTDENLRYWFSRIKAHEAWSKMNTLGVYYPSDIANIAIIDGGGFNPNHQEFNSSQIIDTVDCSNSNNCLFNSSFPYKNNVLPLVAGTPVSSHGTFVSSVAMSSLNGVGSVGISYKSKVLMIHTNDTAKAIKYVRDFNASSNTNEKIKVINISTSLSDSIPDTPPSTIPNYKGYNALDKYPVEYNTDVRNEINNAYNSGVLTVITAGNLNYGIGYPYKSDYINSKALVVGGTAKYTNTRWDDYRNISSDARLSGSNFGPRVDIAAPAEDILLADQSSNKYVLNSGTSFAAPQVAAAAAILMSLQNRPDLRNGTPLSVEKVKNLLIHSSQLIQTDKALGKRNGNVNYSSPNGRLLDIDKALYLATNIQNGGNYARAYNIDSFVSFTHIPSYSTMVGVFRDDKIMSLSSSSGSVNFATLNRGCTYSVGYQVWKSNGDVVEYVKGIAGKWMPLKTEGTESFSNSVINDWLTNSIYNTGIPEMPSPGQAYTINY